MSVADRVAPAVESAQAHTPGPWKLETVPTTSGSCHKIGPFPGFYKENYACVYADGIRIGIDEKLPRAQVLLANARLIAAAPELLEALSRIVQLNDAMPAEHPGRLSHGEYVQACAAIARATGAAQ